MIRTLLFSSIIALALSGCAGTVRLPFANVERSAACPAQKDIACAPQMSHTTLLLNKAPVVVRLLDVEGVAQPQYTDYIGTVFHAKDASGTYPRFCATPADTSPFIPNDYEFKSLDHSAEYRATLGRTLSVGAEADLASAAKQLGALPANDDTVEAAFQAAVDDTRRSQISADFRMLLVRLTVPSFNSLIWGTDSRFDDCRRFLRSNPDYRLVDSMTVFQISKSSLAAAITRDIVANFAASAAVPTAEKSADKLAKLEAGLQSAVSRNIDTVSGEYYVIAALGLMQPSKLKIPMGSS